MVEQTDDFDEMNPLDISMQEDERGEFVRFEVTIHPALDQSNETETLSHRRHLFDNDGEHVHPQQEEFIEVLSGTYGVAVEGTNHFLDEGDDITVPENTPHRQWNPTDEPIRVAHEHRPPRQSAAIYESLYALAQAGKTDETGMPGPLQLAVLSDEYPGHSYLASIPLRVQKVLFSLLAPVGRLAGYEATHSREEVAKRD